MDRAARYAGQDWGRDVRTGITAVWMTDPHRYAESVQDQVWGELAAQPDWQAWLGLYILGADRHSIVFYEDRHDDRLVIRGDTLRCVVPIEDVRTAFERHDLPDFMAHLFHELYFAWAQKLGVPEPPALAHPVH